MTDEEIDKQILIDEKMKNEARRTKKIIRSLQPSFKDMHRPFTI